MAATGNNKKEGGSLRQVGGDDLVAIAELERQKLDSRRRLDQLNERRHALSQACESLGDEEMKLIGRLSAADEERERFSERLDLATRRIMQMDQQIDLVKKEVTALEIRVRQAQRRQAEIEQEEDALHQELAKTRAELSVAFCELEEGRSALERMDTRLSRENQDE